MYTDSTTYIPLGQAVAILEAEGQYDPAGQAVHTEDPSLAAKVPAAHGVQASALEEEKLPAGHISLLVVEVHLDPGGHSVHADWAP